MLLELWPGRDHRGAQVPLRFRQVVQHEALLRALAHLACELWPRGRTPTLAHRAYDVVLRLRLRHVMPGVEAPAVDLRALAAGPRLHLHRELGRRIMAMRSELMNLQPPWRCTRPLLNAVERLRSELDEQLHRDCPGAVTRWVYYGGPVPAERRARLVEG